MIKKEEVNPILYAAYMALQAPAYSHVLISVYNDHDPSAPPRPKGITLAWKEMDDHVPKYLMAKAGPFRFEIVPYNKDYYILNTVYGETEYSHGVVIEDQAVTSVDEAKAVAETWLMNDFLMAVLKDLVS